jgi:hypothetical protein
VEQKELVLTARQALYRAEEYLSQFKGLGRWPWEENLPSRREDFTDQARNEAKRLYDHAFRAWAECTKTTLGWWRMRTSWTLSFGSTNGVSWNGKPLPDDFPLRHFPSLLPCTP